MSTIFSNADFVFLETVESTNAYLQNHISKPHKDVVIITADEQTKGKGQGKNSWHSEKNKNLIFSIGLNAKKLDLENPFLINKITALSITDLLSQLSIRKKITIKWPNDIYVDKRKIAGILIENTLYGNELQKVVIGIGLNVNQVAFPESLPNPTSIKIETSKEYNIKSLLNTYLTIFEKWHALLTKNNAIIDKAYQDILFQHNVFATYQINGEFVSAKIFNIDNYGRLCLKTKKDKKIICCNAKDIKFVL